jgi:glycosyltransferase involved in cell wall biosynthesis
VAFLEQELAPQLGGGVTLLLVGKAAPDSWHHTSGAVRRLGYVEDLSRVLAASDVALNPVTFGSGSNLKLPEYLAAGLPVVTTPIGMRGFEHLSQWLTVAELSEFASAVRAPKPVTEEARSKLTDWTWSNLGRSLRRTYDHLLSEAPREPR